MTALNAATVVCPSCQRPYEVNAKRNGRTIKCWCGGAISFPKVAAGTEGSIDVDAAAFERGSGPESAAKWQRKFVANTVWCMLLSIPLAFVGVRMQPRVRTDHLGKKERRTVHMVLLSALVSVILAIAIPLLMGVRFGLLNGSELRMAIGVIAGSAVLSMILPAIHPVMAFVSPVLVAAASYFSSQHILEGRQAIATALQGHIGEYAQMAPSELMPVSPGGASLHGKVVVLDRATLKLDNLQFLLPGDLQARQPSDVGTIAWVRWGEQVAGNYEGHKGRAIRRIADVTFVDNTTRGKVAYHKVFIGEPPKQGGDVDLYGDAPTQGIIEFLEASSGK